MKFKFLVVCFFVFLNFKFLAQDCSRSSQDWLEKYRLQSNYVPNSNYEAVKTLPINIVIFGENDGSKYPISPIKFDTTRADYESWINIAYHKTQNTSCKTSCPDYLTDTKIRIVINKVYYLDSTAILNDGSSNQLTNALNFHLKQNPEAVNFVNCYLVRNSNQGLGYANFQQYKGETIPSILSGTNFQDNMSDWGGDSFYFINHLHHEIGHLLGLYHINKVPKSESLIKTDLDFLCDVYDDPPAYIDGCNNVMGGIPSQSSYFSPLQIGRMHRGLSTDVGFNGEGVRYLRHYAYGYSVVPHEVVTDETWDFVFKSYNDIVVKNGAVLTLTCRLEMVPQAKISVEQGGKLILDGATITSARNAGPSHEGRWKGIEIRASKRKSNTEQDSSFYEFHGIIELKNGAVIENAETAIKLHKKLSKTDGGGIILMNDASIRNCTEGIHFSAYPIRKWVKKKSRSK